MLVAGFVVKHKEPDDYLLSHGQSALSSAWSRFTVLFGMGRGGTNSLWSSGMTCCHTGLGPAQPIWGEDGWLLRISCVVHCHERTARQTSTAPHGAGRPPVAGRHTNTRVIGSSLTGN